MALRSDRLAIGLLVLGLLVVMLAYSVFVMRAPLQFLSALLPLAFLYLLWRFVLAHERIADALESGGEGNDTVE